MKAFLDQLKARPHLLASTLVGALAVLFVPSTHLVTRLLAGWNVAVWLYLAQAFWIMSRRDHLHLRHTAMAQAEGAGAVLAMAIAAVLASMAAIGLELAAVKGTSLEHALPHVAFALVTVTGVWLLLPTLFALNYASIFYRVPEGHGLKFPVSPGNKEPPGLLGLPVLLVHHRCRIANSRRGHLQHRHAQAGAVAIGDVVRLQHGDPGVHDQHRREPDLGPALATAAAVRLGYG